MKIAADEIGGCCKAPSMHTVDASAWGYTRHWCAKCGTVWQLTKAARDSGEGFTRFSRDEWELWVSEPVMQP